LPGAATAGLFRVAQKKQKKKPSNTQRFTFHSPRGVEVCVQGSFASFISEHLLITAAAYVSLVLTLMLVLWFKFTDLLHAMFVSVTNGIRHVLDFRDELRLRGRVPRPTPPAAGSP
jgi:hypothetical protein